MDLVIDEDCQVTEPCFTHVVNCEEEELDECQQAYYAKRFDDFSAMVQMMKSCQEVLANASTTKTLPPTPPILSSSSSPRIPGIRPIDINILRNRLAIQDTNKSLPAGLPNNQSNTNQLRPTMIQSPVMVSSSETGYVWLDEKTGKIMPGTSVRLLVSSPNLGSSQTTTAIPRPNPVTRVRVSLTQNPNLNSSSSTICIAGPNRYTSQLAHQNQTFVSLQSLPATPSANQSAQTTIIASSHVQTPPVQAVHVTPNHPTSALRINLPSTTGVASDSLESSPARGIHSLPQQPASTTPSTSQQPGVRKTPWMEQNWQQRAQLPQPPPKSIGDDAALRKTTDSLITNVLRPTNPTSMSTVAATMTVPSNGLFPVPEGVTTVMLNQGQKDTPLIVQVPSTTNSSPNLGQMSKVAAEPKQGMSLPLLPCTKQPEKTRDLGQKEIVSSTLVDLTDEEESATFVSPLNNVKRLNGDKILDKKIFPSLVVVARPTLRKYTSENLNSERQAFDAMIRTMLACPVGTFLKKLFRLGLLHSKQRCAHNIAMIFREPPSWTSRCCPDKSVFANSIFEGSSLSPVGVIKLLYHWACNTNVQNVVVWVKVDNLVVKNYYTHFRAICTTVVQERTALLGGHRKIVQIGVISLGTTAEEDGVKEVKLDILAAMEEGDQSTIRLKALNNNEILKSWDDETVYRYKFKRIVENLRKWVDPASTIVLDFNVDPDVFHQYGFRNMVLCPNLVSTNNISHHPNNYSIMSYLQKTIPQMFQNTLNLLSINIIQQFLDELVWREIWGPIAPLAYENLTVHIAEIMKLPGPPILSKLKMIAQNPSDDWTYSVWKDKPFPRGKTGAPGPSAKNSQRVDTVVNKSSDSKKSTDAVTTPMASTSSLVSATKVLSSKVTRGGRPGGSNYKISLELYYYGFIKGDSASQSINRMFSAHCVFCPAKIGSSKAFTEHLIAHALVPTFEMSWTEPIHSVCKYCFVEFTDNDDHMNSIHPPPRFTPTTCKICVTTFDDTGALIDHMRQTHAELDMPYYCEICGFRTSVYEEILTHFAKLHDLDPYAVCPHCLKVVKITDVSPDWRGASQQNYFVQHVQKHRNEHLNKKCEKCVLSFINHDALKEHQDLYHVSCKGMDSVTRYRIVPSLAVLMDRPAVPPLPSATSSESSFHTLKGKVLPPPPFKLEQAAIGFHCLECDALISESHYTLKLKCTKCSFTTHCPNVIKEHSAREHYLRRTEGESYPRIGGIPILDRVYFCDSCNYSSKNGNAISRHLAIYDHGCATLKRRQKPGNAGPKRRRLI